MNTLTNTYSFTFSSVDVVESAYNGNSPLVPLSIPASAATPVPSKGSDIAGEVESFLTFIQATPQTVEVYKRCIRQFFRYLCDTNTTAPTKRTIRDYIAALEQAGKKPATIAGYLAAVKAFFRYLEDCGIYSNVAQNIKAPKQVKGFKKDCLTVEQTRESLETFDTATDTGKRDYAIFLLMVVNGLRTIEVSRLTVGDLRTVDGVEVLMVHGKGRAGADAKAILSSNVSKAIRAYLSTRKSLSEDEPLFLSASNNSKGKAISTRTVSAIAKTAMKQAGYNSPRLTAHSLRHTAITLGLKSGVTLEEASAFARHTSINTTMIYNHALEELANPVASIVDNVIFSTSPTVD